MIYNQRARDWFERAVNERDEFVKFILFYIALEVLTKLNHKKIRDIKSDENLKNFFFKEINQEKMLELKKKLDDNPLKNENPSGDKTWSGQLENTKDFCGIVEFIIRARNNLFHGDKGPNEERDKFIVKWGNIFIEPIVDKMVNKI